MVAEEVWLPWLVATEIVGDSCCHVRSVCISAFQYVHIFQNNNTIITTKNMITENILKVSSELNLSFEYISLGI